MPYLPDFELQALDPPAPPPPPPCRTPPPTPLPPYRQNPNMQYARADEQALRAAAARTFEDMGIPNPGSAGGGSWGCWPWPGGRVRVRVRYVEVVLRLPWWEVEVGG